MPRKRKEENEEPGEDDIELDAGGTTASVGMDIPETPSLDVPDEKPTPCNFSKVDRYLKEAGLGQNQRKKAIDLVKEACKDGVC
jgi:hypothetical protein